MNRFLIISADDFGLCPSVDEAIAELFHTGKITSAGILAPAPRARAACALAARHGWSTGVHWTLHSEWPGAGAWPPLAGPEKAESLLGDGSPALGGGKLAHGHGQAKKAKAAHVRAELLAQYAFMVSCGNTPDHADSHGGTLYGINGRLFFIEAFRLCKRFGLPFRFAHSDGFLRRQFGRPPGAALHLARRAITGCGQLYGVKMPFDFFSNPSPAAKIESAARLEDWYENELTRLAAGMAAMGKAGKTAAPCIAEVFMHPALPDDTPPGQSPEWQKRVWEYEFLKSGRLLQKAKALGFTLASWRDAPF